MKTLVNKHNPEIRIIAPEIITEANPYSDYVYWIPSMNEMFSTIDWTLVEEEPEKIYYKMLDNKANCPFDKGDCRYCTVQFCGAREENHIETRSTAEPVDLEEEIRRHTALFQADIEYPLRLTAIKFYKLGRIAQIEQNKALADMHKSPKEKGGSK